MIIVLPKLIAKSFSAMTIYPFIILKEADSRYNYVLLNHEHIHIKQQKELLWLLFFIWYFVEYIIKLIYYRNSYKAYKNISFEREAYYYENDPDYIHDRPFYNFLKFVF